MIAPKQKTLLFILFSFVLGAVSGGFFTRYVLMDRGWRSSLYREIQKEFATRLQLSSEQQKVVDSIVVGHRAKFDEIRTRFGAEFKAQRESLRVDIRKVLTPEQNARYDEYIKEMEVREGRRDRARARRD
ncbi:MAG TPA: hypothetical protein VNN76_08190 [Bacteroidota bacterium]|nr:hypothetical protein [Bacteroidota bacterium]